VEAALIGNRDLLIIADRQVRLMMPQEVEEKIELDFPVLRDRSLLSLQTGLPVADQVNRLLVHMDFNPGVGPTEFRFGRERVWGSPPCADQFDRARRQAGDKGCTPK